jgi:3-oxoacyl-[acyl-carrier protein] reductase
MAKTVLITGATGALGAAIALRLGAKGHTIWANCRANHARAERLAQGIESVGGVCRIVPFDVTDSDQVKAALEPLLAEAIPDVLVNGAGITRDGLMMWMREEDWRDVIDVSLGGFFLVTRAVLMGMLERGSGRIINIASTSGQSPLPGQTNYAAAKAGLIAATKALAAEVARRGVSVNAVSPGFIESEMTAGLPRDKILPNIPLGRFGYPDEVAEAVDFLCSDAAGHIVGQVLSVNGGIRV